MGKKRGTDVGLSSNNQLRIVIKKRIIKSPKAVSVELHHSDQWYT